MVERTYYIRNKRVTVDEVQDVVSARGAERRGDGSPATSMLDANLVETLRTGRPVDNANETALAAFEAAGWRVLPADSRGEARRDRDDDTGRLVRRPSGALAIVTRQLNVQLKADLDEQQVAEELGRAGLEVVNRLTFAPNLFEVVTRAHEDALQASEELHDNPAFEFAEPNLVEHIPPRLTPTDPNYGDQWQWSNTGQNGGTPGADVSAEAAWDITLGAGIRVASIDNGFDADHEDLVAGVVPQSGFFTDPPGAAPVAFTQGTAGMPDGNHGTFCAGMIGARQNNGVGVSGAAPACELMLISCLGDQVGTQTTLARALAYAADPTREVAGANPADGADIITSSLGPNGAEWLLTATLDLAIQFAAVNGRGGLGSAIFWAVSNGDNVDIAEDEVVSHADVIAVGRSTRTDNEDDSARGADLELLAPGVEVFSTESGNGYGTSTGTSFAAPCAAGCAALALSVNPDLTRDELRTIMRETSDKIGGAVYDATGHSDDFGFGRVNAEAAVRRAGQRVILETTSLVFNDVPEGEITARAIVWQASGFAPLTFQIVSGPIITSGPANAFTPLLGSSVTIPAPGAPVGAKARLWFTYRGTLAGDVATGTVRVRCVETGQEWDVSLSGDTIARPRVAVALVLDQSGSMDADAGDGRRRVEVLREAAAHFVQVIQPENGIGVVRFDHDAVAAMAVTEAGPEIFGPGRATASVTIASHATNAGGATSIGDGLELGGSMLDATTGYDHTAMIVLTDGQENADKFIADVSASIDDRVFAIGLGTPEVINPAALNAITAGSGGYVVMTGALSADEQFVLSKYYLQILAGVTNEEIVLDPDGYLKPGNGIDIAFHLTEADAGADVILLSPAPEVLGFELVTPTGDVIGPAALPAGVKRVVGPGIAYYRFNLPVVSGSGRPAGAGRWTVRLKADPVAFRRWLSTLDNNPLLKQAQTHGLRYAVEVHARSSVRLKATVSQKDITAGSILRLGARLTEYGLPIEGRAKVRAELKGPAGPTVIELDEQPGGTFAAEHAAHDHGLYTFRIVAQGRTLRGSRFSREQTLTGAIYIAKPPEDPPPPKPDGSCATSLCTLGKVIADDERLKQQLARALRPHHLQIDTVIKCLQTQCQPNRKAEEDRVESGDHGSAMVKADMLARTLRTLADQVEASG